MKTSNFPRLSGRISITVDAFLGVTGCITGVLWAAYSEGAWHCNLTSLRQQGTRRIASLGIGATDYRLLTFDLELRIDDPKSVVSLRFSLSTQQSRLSTDRRFAASCSLPLVVVLGFATL